jgi:hypothetical protein
MTTSPVVELRLQSRLLVVGQVALGLIGVAFAAAFVAVPTGGARVVGTLAAVALVSAVALLIRALRRQAVVVDGDRLGYRHGPFGNVSGWTDLADVEMATVAKLSTSVPRARADVILWTPVGGLRGLSGVLLRWEAPSGIRAGGRLHPFLLPLSALRDADRATLDALLARHGIVG